MPADPRAALVAYFDAVRQGDENKALACWMDDVDAADRRKYTEEIVRAFVRQSIAAAHLEDSMRQKLPTDFQKLRHDGNAMPNDAQLATCRFTTYLRLAICAWGSQEDDGLPMVLDSSRHPATWRISMQQWYETNRSSVVDSMLITGWQAKAMELTEKEVLAGKLKNADEVELSLIDHMNDLAEAEDAPAATQPKYDSRK
jgi:hypothetical protein